MRTSRQERVSKETQISLSLNLDGGEVEITTGIGFFDHMLTAFAVHGGFGLKAEVMGDLEVDCHHTVEDAGIVLGRAFAEALGGKQGIARFGHFHVPMDESLAVACADVSGRPFLVFRGVFSQETIGGYDACMTEEFWRAFVMNAGVTLHLEISYGSNAHHETEAVFKAAGHALREAVKPMEGVLSTKGLLD